MWIARDKNGALKLHVHEPKRVDDKINQIFDSFMPYDLPQELCPEVTWENSPRKVKSIKIELE